MFLWITFVLVYITDTLLKKNRHALTASTSDIKIISLPLIIDRQLIPSLW